jgi:hypothetical protein
MVSWATSSGVNVARGTSAVARFTQYRQLKAQRFVNSILSRDMHRPSSDQLWQIPGRLALPNPPGLFRRELPLDEQDTSYLAAAPRIFNFVCKSMMEDLPLYRVNKFYHILVYIANICLGCAF